MSAPPTVGSCAGATDLVSDTCAQAAEGSRARTIVANVLFIDASREFRSGKNQNQLTVEGEASNVSKIVRTHHARQSVPKYAHLATPEEIAGNDFNLNIPRYVDTFEEETEIDLVVVHAERQRLKAELEELESKMDGYLKELGY